MRKILQHLEAYQAEIGNSADISAEGFKKLDAMTNQLRAATMIELNRSMRPDERDERARQAAAQGAGDGLMGRRHD